MSSGVDDGSTSSDVGGVIITGDLDHRPSRAPDHQAENQALTALAEAMSTNPGTVLQRLVEVAMELTRSASAGISLLEPGGENGTFRWVATAGAWSPYRDGTMPREASPCGEVIAREAVLLMKNPERSFPALLQAEPGISEGLLAPFHLGGVPVGTVWTIKHRPDDHFEAEDARLVKSLARFAAAAHQTVQALRLAKAAGQRAAARFQQLVTLADVSSEFFGTCDMSFMPTYGNVAAMRMVGLTDLEQVKRTPLQEFFFPEDLPFITEEFFPRVLRDGQAKVETRFRHFVTGEPVWVDYSLVVLKDEMGRATGLGTVTHDLTERKRADAALRESEARFRALATVGSSSVYRMSPDWRELRHLDGAAFLADTNQATTDWADTYIPPDERPRLREAINRAITTKGVFELEHRVLRADGTVGWTASRAIPLLDDAGEISEWFGTATDVTARVKADQSFTRLFQASSAPFLVLRPDAPHFTIIEVNDAYLAATMRTRDEVVGRGIFEAYPANPSEETAGGVSALQASLEHVLASRQPDTLPGLKYDVARPDGTFEERWWSPVNSAVLDDDGEVEALIHNANDVTEERRAEGALRESETRFRQFSDASTNILWIRNAATMRMEFASPAFDAIYGIAGPDRGGDDRLRSWARLVVPEDRRRVLSNFRRVRAGERAELEFRVRSGSDGEVRWIRDVEFPLTDDQGRVQRVAGVGQDITAQKRVEEALREREERLSLIVENAQDYAIFTIDPAGKITDWREGAEAVFGWSRSEAIGMDARDIFTPQDRETGELEREMKVALEEGRAPDVRWHHRKDGSRVFIDGALTRLGDGTTTGFLKIGQDVTERHRAEAALSASEGRLQTLMEGIPQLVWRSCDNGLWTWASPQWLDFTGQTQEQSHGTGWLDAVHPDDQEPAKRAWEEARSHGLLDVDYRVRQAADGGWIWHHTRSVPVRGGHGRIVEWLGTSTDVQMLKEMQERQGVLVGELQHRTRNLIAVVRSTSDKTARASTDLPDFRRRFRERLDALARVQGLLSRLNDLDRVTFDELIRAELSAMDGDADRVTLEGPPDIRLRSSTVQTLAMGLHELATNAVKYGALGQPDGRLAITWWWESSGEGGEPWLHIDWRETGVIMPMPGASPRGTGQGRELIERALPYQLSAKTSYNLGREGVHCTISLPVSATAGSKEDHD